VQARSRAWVRRSSASTGQQTSVINGRVVTRRASARMREVRMGAWKEEVGRLLPARRHGRQVGRLPAADPQRDQDRDAWAQIGDCCSPRGSCAMARAQAPRRRRCWPTPTKNRVIDYAPTTRGGWIQRRPAPEERRGVDRGAPAGGQAGPQGGGGAPPASGTGASQTLGEFDSAVAEFERPDGDVTAHLPLRERDARMGENWPGARHSGPKGLLFTHESGVYSPGQLV